MVSCSGSRYCPSTCVSVSSFSSGEALCCHGRRPLEQVDDRVQGTVLVVWQTPAFQPCVGLAGDLVLEHLYQATLANASLATQQDHLSLPLFDPVPALQEEADFLLAPDQWCQTTRTHDVQPTLRPTVTQDAIDLEGFSNAPEGLTPQICHREIALHQTGGIGTDHHRIGGRQALDSGRDVRGFA